MAEPADTIVPQLREMRAEISARFLLSKLVPGEFEERIEALEKKVKELETLK